MRKIISENGLFILRNLILLLVHDLLKLKHSKLDPLCCSCYRYCFTICTENENAEIKFKEAELNTLRNQMNPHFIYNALNSIQNFIFKNDPVRANYLLSRFGTLIRKSLDLSKLNYIPIDEEITFLENYLELEKMRFEDRFDFNIIKSQNITNNEKVPPLLIQPIIENSIKHGFSGIKKKGQITIEFVKTTSNLKIYVSDNGKGIKPVNIDDKDEEKPHALYIIRERINIINEANSEKAYFDIKPIIEDDIIKGTRATFLFPIIISEIDD